MGRLKLKKSTRLLPNTPNKGLSLAMVAAEMQLNKENELREILAKEKVGQEIVDENYNNISTWLYACVALALHEAFGFGAGRVARVLQLTEEKHQAYVKEHAYLDDIVAEVEETIGMKMEVKS